MLSAETDAARKAQEENLTRLLRVCGFHLYRSAPQLRTQAAALQTLRERGPICQKDLQDHLMVQSGSVSELVTKLETKGLVERTRDARDRRRVLLSLTPLGERKAEHASVTSDIPVRYSGLSLEEMQTLCALLETIIASWKEDGVPEGELRLPTQCP